MDATLLSSNMNQLMNSNSNNKHHHNHHHPSSSSSTSSLDYHHHHTTITTTTQRRPRSFNSNHRTSSSSSPSNSFSSSHRYPSGSGMATRRASGSLSPLPHASRMYTSASNASGTTGELPTWTANPQSPGEDPNNTATGTSSRNSSPSFGTAFSHGMDSSHQHQHQHQLHNYARRRSTRNSQRFWRRRLSLWQWMWGLAFLAFLSVAFRTRFSFLDSMKHVTLLLQNNHELSQKLYDAERGIRKLQRQASNSVHHDAMWHHTDTNGGAKDLSLPHHIDSHEDSVLSANNDPSLYARNRALEEMNLLSDRLKVSQAKAQILKDKVQALSKQEAIQKYGNHVHQVLLELEFPDQLEGPHTLVMELASLDIMPHSVHFFLEMVSSGLLDGCSFILNALHVLKAAPLPYDGSSAANKARAFTRLGLESVAFKEYDPRYPHQQYTVGFAADGSPSFYINTEDNSEIHLGDPCFGKIVEGLDTVKRLEASPTRNGIWFEQRIGIKRATVLM